MNDPKKFFSDYLRASEKHKESTSNEKQEIGFAWELKKPSKSFNLILTMDWSVEKLEMSKQPYHLCENVIFRRR
jgi:capsule polysaccharide export protein KpsC/LpsZ